MTTDTAPRGESPLPDEMTGQPQGSGPDEVADVPVRHSPTRRPPMRRRAVSERPDEDDRGWRMKGQCLGLDPERWFSPHPVWRAQAVSICSACPVRSQCFSWATRTGQRFGIWGGVDLEVAATPGGVASSTMPSDAAAFEAAVARLPLVDRMHVLLGQHPGVTTEQAAEILGYKSANSLERALYRRGDEGRKLIRVLKPGSRSRERVIAEKVTFRGLSKKDPDHPWLVEAALPVNGQRSNVQHRKTGKPGRREGASVGSTEEDAV